jgi:hypothetical protein
MVEMELDGPGGTANHTSLANFDPQGTRGAAEQGHMPGIDLHGRIEPDVAGWCILHLPDQNDRDRRTGNAKANAIAGFDSRWPVNQRIV